MPTNRSHRLCLAGVLVCGLLLAPPKALAQEEFGRLYGSVGDGNGTPLPGVTVTLAGPGATQSQDSDALGKFRFPRLGPGRYSLRAALDGFSPLEQPNIEIRAGRTITLPLKIVPEIDEVITVTSETPLLDERKLSRGTLVSHAELEGVPTAGDALALVNQAPGVMIDQIDVGGSDNNQGRFSAPGVDSRQNDWLIDGVPITDMDVQGVAPLFFDLGQADQVELSTGGNDLSKATAGVAINVVTRRGTNEIRGSARYLITDQDLFWFFKESSPNVDPNDFPPGQGTEIEANQIERIENYGFELGGPLLRDRVWLWGSFGRNEFAETQVGGFPFANQTEQIAVKINAQLSKSNSLIASWNEGDKEAANFGIGQGVAWASAWNQMGPGATVLKIEDTHIFSSQLLLTGRWAEVDGRFSLVANGCLAAGSCDEAKEFLRDANGVEQNSYESGQIDYPSSEWKVDGSYFFGTGRISHELAFGGRWREFESSDNFHWPGGRDIGHFAGENLGLPDGVGMFFAQRGEGPPVTQEYGSLWVQDTLTSGKWTVNAGLRYDRQQGENPAFSVPANPALPEYLPAVEFEGNDGGRFDWQSVSPRFGVTYALGEERNTLLRASFSRFPGALGRAQIDRLNPVSPVYGNFFFSDGNGNDMWDGREEEFWLCCADGYDPANPTDLGTPNRTDPDLGPELTDELVLGVEHALRPELVVGASLTWRTTSDVLEERAFLRELDTGTERLARREDYVFFGSLEVTQPDGQPYDVDYYTLDPARFVLTGGNLLVNGDRQVDYLGASLTLTKRLTNRWMLRGFINYGRPEWDIPESFLVFDDPTEAVVGDLRAADKDGDLFAQFTQGGRGGRLLHSTWSFNLNGMVQIAPERPWGFNVAGNLYGRQGYPIPLFARSFTPDVGRKLARAVATADDFRYDDVYTVDLRLEKEFRAWDHAALTLSADVFNALNAGTVLGRVPRLNLPVANYVLDTLSPRIWRLGVRFNWR
jgi:hypothetical protein